MLWIIERILERLLLKSALQMSSEKEAEMELEHVESRAGLLRRAEELEQEKVPGFDELVATLRRRATEMEVGRVAPGADVLGIAADLQAGGFQDADAKKASRLVAPEKDSQKSLPAPGGKKRGRPRKNPLPDSNSESNAES